MRDFFRRGLETRDAWRHDMLRLDHVEAMKAGKITAPKWHAHFRCTIPPSTRGSWTIEKFTVEIDLQNMRMMRDGRGCLPGEYTRLVHKTRGVVMSDTTAEIDDQSEPYWHARGRCLVHGLGLGCTVKGLLSRPEVASIDVVEVDADVIALVEPHLRCDRLVVHHADCFKKRWGTNVRWGVVWHDIWDNICGDNLSEMERLRAKFRGKCKWQGCWGEEETRERRF